MNQLNTLQFTEVCSKRLSEVGLGSHRSQSTSYTSKQQRRNSILNTEKLYRAMERNS